MISIKATQDNMVLCENMMVLTKSQYEKLECEALQDRIDGLCKDLHINGRYVRNNGNMKISIVSTIVPEYNDQVAHDIEIAHINLLSEIDKLELPHEEPVVEEFTSPTNADRDRTESVKIIKSIMEDSVIIDHAIIYVDPCDLFRMARISKETICEAFEAFLEKYDN